MKIGDQVVVLGKQDKRIREREDAGMVIGTLDQILTDGQVSVLLKGGDIWVGNVREIVLAKEQE